MPINSTTLEDITKISENSWFAHQNLENYISND